MRKNTNILYAVTWFIYVVFSMVTFPFLGISVAIPMVVLVGLGSWIYGRTYGLLLIILATFYRYLLSSEFYADILTFYESRLTGTLILIAVVFLAENLKRNLTAIKKSNHKLDLLVKKRNAELTEQALKLIDESEQISIERGQSLHDGIGQYMTGIQLFSSPLAERLLAEKHSSSTLAFSIQHQGEKTHNLIRQIARMMFPVKIDQVGLIPALHELASFFLDFKQVEFRIKTSKNLPELPKETALQLYRICQENSNYAIYQLNADQVEIDISSVQKFYSLKLSHNGISSKNKIKPNAILLIEHRLQLISGRTEFSHSSQGKTKIIYTIPNPTTLVSA